MTTVQTFESVCAAAAQLASTGRSGLEIMLGTDLSSDYLAQLAATAEVPVVETVHQDSRGAKVVFERVEWNTCGVRVTALGQRPFHAGDESLPTFVFDYTPPFRRLGDAS